ncbi:MAG: baseplate J/gp47 family protein [Bacilli bacterium]|nr:baseplate J/gp47 family protein [Bacilli bacterium]
MAFENITLEYVNNLVISGLETELNTRFRLLPKSFVKVLAKVEAGVFMTLYKQQAWIFKQMFIDTATFDEVDVLGDKIRPLLKWGETVGIGAPAGATQWTGTIRVTTTSVNTTLLQGTQFKNKATGQIYITTENKYLANMSEEVRVRCTVPGTVGNLSENDILETVSPLFNIERKAYAVSDGVPGLDAESEESYRARVSRRWKVQPQGGALADYRRWASDVPGVLQVYPYKDPDSASGVLIFVSATNESRVPSSELLVAIGEACTYDPETGEATRKPMGAVLDPDLDGTYRNVRPCEISEFEVRITGFADDVNLSSFKSQARSAIQKYFKEREPWIRGLSVDKDRTDRISVNNLLGIVNDIAESLSSYFDTLTLYHNDIEIPSYDLAEGELSVLGKLIVNGEIVE